MSENIYIKNKKAIDTGTENTKEMIRVVPSMFWLTIVGGIIILVSMLLWSIYGEIIETVRTKAIYLSSAEEHGEILCFIPIIDGKRISEGMDVTVSMSSDQAQKYGSVSGQVTYVEPYVTGYDRIIELLGDQSMAQVFESNGPVVLVSVKLETSSSSVNGYKWSSAKGNSFHLSEGTLFNAIVVTDKNRPIDYVLTDVKKEVEQ